MPVFHIIYYLSCVEDGGRPGAGAATAGGRAQPEGQ